MKATLGYLAAGVGIGAALSIFFAPRSGEQSRRWVANKCFDAIDAANSKVWHSRIQVRGIMDRGQRQISQAVAAGRESFGMLKAAQPSQSHFFSSSSNSGSTLIDPNHQRRFMA
jgi:gas vesicle protein